MSFMKWKLSRQKSFTADEKGMLEAFDAPTDFTDKENIKGLVKFVRDDERNRI